MERVIEVKFPGGKKVDAVIDGTVIRTDQQVENGGDGTAPEPFSLFLASLATCAGFYAKAFCINRDIPSEGLELKMRCLKDETAKNSLYSKMIFELKLPDGFPDKYKTAISRSIDLCAVKRHLMDAPEFELIVES